MVVHPDKWAGSGDSQCGVTCLHHLDLVAASTVSSAAYAVSLAGTDVYMAYRFRHHVNPTMCAILGHTPYTHIYRLD